MLEACLVPSWVPAEVPSERMFSPIRVEPAKERRFNPYSEEYIDAFMSSSRISLPSSPGSFLLHYRMHSRLRTFQGLSFHSDLGTPLLGFCALPSALHHFIPFWGSLGDGERCCLHSPPKRGLQASHPQKVCCASCHSKVVMACRKVTGDLIRSDIVKAQLSNSGRRNRIFIFLSSVKGFILFTLRAWQGFVAQQVTAALSKRLHIQLNSWDQQRLSWLQSIMTSQWGLFLSLCCC